MRDRKHPWLKARVTEALRHGFVHAYETVKVDPARFLFQLQAAYGLPITSYPGLYSVELGKLDHIASDIRRASMKMAAAEGAGLGLGGLLTLIPDVSILAAITLRAVQKLSLIYGFEYNTDGEIAELWIAAASAAGVDISRELIEKEVVTRFVPRVIQRIALKASTEVIERWAGRVIPVASSVMGAGLNYYFVQAWSDRAQSHFRERHVAVRQRASSDRAGVIVAENGTALQP
ncbi:MAG: EcsC family protein [Acidobacteria bacterium]|nr:EcsC family protein [Acidobacteriota bacterium]